MKRPTGIPFDGSVNIKKLVWAKNQGETYYNLLLRKYIRENKKVRYMDPQKLMWAVEYGYYVCADMKGSIIDGEIHIPIELSVMAERFRKYYKIHKSQSAREAYLILLANKETIFVVVVPAKLQFINSN